MLRHSGGSWVDTETGEIIAPRGHAKPPPLMKVPSFKQTSAKSFTMPKINLPPIGTIINIAVMAAVGLAGYKLYMKFFGQSALDIANTKGSAAMAATVISNDQAKADQLSATSGSLGSKGLVVTDMHKSIANTFHDMFNTWWINDDEIVKTILGENVQTFRLVSLAYGSRTIPDYDAWHIGSVLSAKDALTFKDTLKLVLDSDSLAKIHAYYTVI